MKNIYGIWLLGFSLFLSGCMSDPQPSNNDYEHKIEEYNRKFDEYKKHQECLENYHQRTQICIYFNRGGEEIIRNAKVEKCIRDKFPKGRESCD